MKTKRILIVEDDSICSRVFEHLMQNQGYTVLSCSNGADAVALAMSDKPDLVLLDLGLPAPDPAKCRRFDGFTVLEWLGRIAPSTPVIVVTAQRGVETRRRALEANALLYLEKPVLGNRLVEAARIALEEEHLSSSVGAETTLAA